MLFFKAIASSMMTVFVTCAAVGGHLCPYPSRTDRQLHGSVYVTLHPGGEYACHLTCWYSSRCAAFNWDTRFKVCQLCDSSEKMQPWNLRTSPGVVYGEPRRCQGTGHACADRPCRVDEMCMPAVKATQHICLSLESFLSMTTMQTATPIIPSSGTSTYTTTQTTTAVVSTTTSPTMPTSTTTTSSTTTPSSTSTTSSSTTPSLTTTTPTATTSSTTKPPLTSTTTSPSTTTTISYVAEGCYSQSNHDRVLPTDDDISSSAMTIPMCSAHCKALSKPYIALHKGKDCSCGSTLDTSGHTLLADSECNKACFGDSSTSCGATWKVSVFKVNS